jgi:hypothetical protein
LNGIIRINNWETIDRLQPIASKDSSERYSILKLRPEDVPHRTGSQHSIVLVVPSNLCEILARLDITQSTIQVAYFSVWWTGSDMAAAWPQLPLLRRN